MPPFLLTIWSFIKELVEEYQKDDCFTLGAALSYYTIFSIAPIIVIIIAVAGFVLGPDAVQGELYDNLAGLVGDDAARQIQNLVVKSYQSDAGIIATVIGIITLVFGATGVVNQLKKSLNIIWEMKAVPKNGIIKFLLDRVLSLGLILTLGFILLVTLVIEGIVAALSSEIEALIPAISGPFLVTVNFIISLLLTGGLFAFIFKLLPDARIHWADAFRGGVFTAILFALGRIGINYYLAQGNVGETFGAASFLVILLVWVYYSSQILFLGAEFTQVYARRYGTRIYPTSNSVRVKRTEVTVDENARQP